MLVLLLTYALCHCFSVHGYGRFNRGIKGVNILVEKGIIYKKRGLGMFVSTGAESKIRSERKQEFFDKYIRALVSEAEKLKISRDEIITMIAKQ